MTSFQTELSAGAGVAEELAESQRAISIAEFFEKNKHMLGFDSGARALVTAVKEGVDNSLTRETPFVYREHGETIHDSIGETIDDLIESNPEDVMVKRGGDLEKLRVDGIEALSFDEEYAVDFQRISSVFRHRVNSDVYRITVEGGREVELTDYHSVFVLRNGEIASVETNDIDKDDYVVLPDAEWDGGSLDRIDLVDELLDLPAERTEDVGLYGVEHLIETHYDTIRAHVDAQYRMSDFRKCDRLPFDIVRKLGLNPEEYENCEIGYRFGPNNVPAVLTVDRNLVELLGLYAAEGCVTGRDHEKVYLSLGSHEPDLIARAERLVRDVFGLDPSTVDAHESATKVTIPAKIVGLLFEGVFRAGTAAREKRLPRHVLDFPARLRERFVLGYAAGDGHPTASVIDVLQNGGDIGDVDEHRITLATSSDRLSSGLRYLLSSIGYDATHEQVDGEMRRINGREVEFGTSHLLYVHTDQSSVSCKRLPASEMASTVDDPKLAYNLDGRQERVDTDHALALADGGGLEFAGRGRVIAEGDLTALPVRSIERIDYEGEWVYDVSVPGDENFMAGTAPLACHNSLDATEEAGHLPDIYVEIREVGDYYRLVVEDNGPGITREQVPRVFGKLLYGSRFHKREQNRGQQGIGISAAVLYSQLTSGKAAKITSRTQGQETARYFELVVDTDENEPEVRSESETTWDRSHGTRIELEMEANMRARQALHDYVAQTAVVNPHARIELREPGLDEPLKFERATDQLPAETEEIRPHPHGVELGQLLKLLDATDSYSVSGFLQEEFTRVGTKTSRNVLDAFRDRHFGREMSWTPPRADEERVETAVREAVANKTSEATAAFAEDVAAALREGDRAAHGDVARAVDETADEVEAEYDETFGATVRENAVDAAWTALTDPERLRADCYRLVNDATSKRKDDDAVKALAERLAEKFPEDDRHRATYEILRAYVDRAADPVEETHDEVFGDTARENIVEACWTAMTTVAEEVPRVRDVAGERDTASQLLEAMRATDILAPPTDCLAPITAELVEEGLKKEFDADFYTAVTRDAEVHGGDPFVVEAGIAYGGELETDGTVDLLRFANRVPLVYQRGACAITDVTKRIDWRNYELTQPGGSGMPQGPAVVLVHVASTNVPFTSESKDAVANVPEIEDEIELAVREAARDLKSHLKRRQSLDRRRRKREVLTQILPEMADKVAAVTERERPDVEAALARIMNNVGVSHAAENGRATLRVRNHSDRGEDLEITAILDAAPGDPPDGASVVEMDGEWFLSWEPSVGAGETVELAYDLDACASVDLQVDGVAPEKLTIGGTR